MISKEESKAKIIESFLKNVVGRFPESDDLIKNHKGKKGHWLESNLGGKIDADGNADLDGFECKIESKKFLGVTGGHLIEFFVMNPTIFLGTEMLMKICGNLLRLWVLKGMI